jgi:hypothetical protein
MKKSLQDGHPHSYAVCDLTVNKTGRMIKDLGIKFDTNVHRSWMEDGQAWIGSCEVSRKRMRTSIGIVVNHH